jgi:uncharacterized protein (DUF2336 family)
VSLSACLVSETADSAAPAPFFAGAAGFNTRKPADEAPDGSAQLIEKLAASGQLKAGFLLRVLQQGQVDMFELAFARLLGIDRTRLRRILDEGGPRLLAMACHAVGIDRAAFPTVYSISRKLRRQPHLLDASERLDAVAIFETYGRTEARARLLTV